MGEVYQRADGKSDFWYGTFTDATGKRQRVSLKTGDKSIAKLALAKLEAEALRVKHGIGPADVDFEVFLKRLEEWMRPRKADNTTYHRIRALREFQNTKGIVTTIGEITPEALDDVQAVWYKEKRAPAMSRKFVKEIKAAMKIAEGWYKLEARPWHTITPLWGEPKGRLLWYRTNELVHLLNTAKAAAPHWLTFGLLGSRAGLRRGEILSRPWAHIHFHDRVIEVADYKGWETKTKSSKRYVSMADDVYQNLLQRREAFPDTEYVIQDEHNWRPGYSSVTTYWARIARRAQLKGSAHTLRHTFASHLVSAGVPLFTVQKLLGHSSSEETEIYAHLAPEAMQAGVNVFNKGPLAVLGQLAGGAHPSIGIDAVLPQLKMLS